MAVLQVDACTPNFMLQEGGHANWFDQVVGEFPKQRDGYFDLPTGPGVGLNMDEAALRAIPPVAQIPPEGYVGAARGNRGWKQQTTWS